jgi:hypothetical protein
MPDLFDPWQHQRRVAFPDYRLNSDVGCKTGIASAVQGVAWFAERQFAQA